MFSRRSKFPGAILIAIVTAILLAAPAAAASPWFSYSQTGTTATADNSECTENPDGTVSCQGQSLYVFKGTVKASGERPYKGEQVCYNEYSDTWDPDTGEFFESEGVFGCAADAGTLTINNLTTIVLAPTVINLTAWQCDTFDCTESPAGSTSVYGTWTGVGPIASSKGRFFYDDGTCVQVHADKGKFREASFEGSFDALWAQMSEGSFKFRTKCSF